MPVKYSQFKDLPSQDQFVFDYESPFNYSSISSFSKSQDYKSAFTYSSGYMSTLDTCNISDENDENWISYCLRIIILSFCYLLVIMTFPVSLILCLKRVPSLERIVLIRLGRLQPIKGPGMVMVYPCIDQSSRVDLKPRILLLQAEKVLTSDGGIVEIAAEIEYQVADIIRFVMRVQRLEETFCHLSHHCLINIASEKEQTDFESGRRVIEAVLQNELNRTVISWGLEVTKVEIPPVKILKPAEPHDAVSTIVSTLKSVLGLPSQENCAEDSQKIEMLANILQPDVQNSNHVQHTVNRITELCNIVVKKGLLRGRNVTYKLQIEEKVLHCCFHEDAVEVKEDANLPSDVSISILKKDLDDLLSHKLSPIDAYQQGKITVTGEWKLLHIFNKMITL